MKKQHQEEHANHEAWAVPYADLLTLLLAFFVVMYSLSQINISKYRVLAEALNEAFNGTGKVIKPVSPASPARQVPLPDQYHAANATPIARIRVPVPPRHLPVPGHEGAASKPSPGTNVQRAGSNNGAADRPGASAPAASGAAQGVGPEATSGTVEGADSTAMSDADAAQGTGPAAMSDPAQSVGPQTTLDKAQNTSLTTISDEVVKALKPWVDSKQVIIRRTKLWLEIEIRTDVLFPSGMAELTDQARGVLNGLAGVLARFSNPIRIEGYTDNRPIDTWKFPSNWELSAARAGSVARLFGGQGVDPSRLGIFGWGEYHPVASNATSEGRNRNRRIAIVVLGDQAMQRRYDYDDNRRVGARALTAPAAKITPAAGQDSAAKTNATTDTSPPTGTATLGGVW